MLTEAVRTIEDFFALQINATITELDLSENCIGPEGAVYMAEALVENSYITHLVGYMLP